jgi:hypothetical protein
LDTSGFSAAEPGNFGRNPAAGQPRAFKLGSTSHTWALSSLRQISQLTGGLASINEDIGRSLTQLNNITRVEYLLGYYPRNTNWNGEYRRIAVKVNRPDLKVSYRHGYYANDTLKMYDREEFLAYSRISAAAAYGQDIADVPFKIITSRVQDEADHSQVRVDLQIDPTRVRFRTANNLHTGKLHIAIFSTDERGRYLGDISRTMDMNLREETYQRVMKSAIPFSILIPYQVPKQILKIVVYDCGSDKIGSLIQQMR